MLLSQFQINPEIFINVQYNVYAASSGWLMSDVDDMLYKMYSWANNAKDTTKVE